MRNQSGPGTVVGANVKLQGTLKDSSDIIVHGQVEGEVMSDQTVTVAESANIKGPVTAQVVLLSGTIRGAVEAKEKLEITPTGRLHGSLMTKNLIINSGAVLNGKSTMDNKAEKTEKEEKNHLNIKPQSEKEGEVFGELEAEIE